jgi:predicted nuclease with RNAse H fold
MLTIGIDLAAQPKNTALCTIEWTGTEAQVRNCSSNVEAAADAADKVGIDVPFGWPQTFVSAVTAYHNYHMWPSATSLALRYRRTDLYVQNATLKWPLSVSSDRIACTAFRAAALLSRIEQRSGRLDRTGSGKFVEVYPRAARDRWGVASLNALVSVTEDWLKLPESVVVHCRESDDCFDALVAALVTRAAATALCDSVPEGDLVLAGIEGWIALPQEGSLARLRSANQPSAAD